MPNLNLKNFAKIKDSDFDIQDITVFAGKPGTGKSYIMKMLYAIDDGVNKGHQELEGLNNYIKSGEGKNLTKQEKIEFEKLLSFFKSIKKFDEKDFINNAYKNIIESIFGGLNQISFNFNVTKEKEIVLKYIDKVLEVEVLNKKNIFRDNIFVETPLILEFKHFMNREEGKTPYHIESLLKILDKDYSFTDSEQDEFIKSFVEKSKAIINGNIENSGDSFIFKTDTQDFSIINASSGIKSIGLLQYLVTNKALKKGSTLYWEEPEVHLHPTWQLKMIDLFIELMNAGVKIVFSTHSPFMADYLNAKATREKFGERVSFNLLSEENGVISNTILEEKNWKLLQDELLGPLEDIMWEYL